MTPKKPKLGEKALREFLSEAQDIAENLGKSLMTIDEALKGGEPDPDLVNDLFRGMHTLKSLSGMFEVQSLTDLAHHEENLLENIRLGRIELNGKILDLLFESLELINQILTRVSETGDNSITDHQADVDRLIKIIENDKFEDDEGPATPDLIVDSEKEKDPIELLGPEIIEVLTEYEEHRLKTNLEKGYPFYRVHTLFNLDSIETSLDAIKGTLKPVGEIITYLPSAEEGEPDKLGIDIIIAVQKNTGDLEISLRGIDAQIEEIVPARSKEPETKALPTVSPPPEQTGIEKEDDESLTPAPDTSSQTIVEAEQAISLRSISQTVRVDIRKLDRLMNVVGELAILRSALTKISDEFSTLIGRGDLAIELHRINRGLDRRLFELREGILEVRMVPLSQVFDRLARLVRKISRKLGKEIHFVLSGAETEVDKLIIEELSDPLMHIVRNSIDHGIENEEERKRVGKPEFGTPL
jgi:two-component system chemotaxis sensor kinase CheA